MDTSPSNEFGTKKEEYKGFYYKYLLQPFISGLMGFALFFFAIVVIKFSKSFIFTDTIFVFDISDVIISSGGFVLAFLYKLLDQIRDKENI